MTNKSYEVKSGDTLWKICQKEFNLKSNTDIANKVLEISKKNNISSNSIFVGQKLNLGIEETTTENTHTTEVEQPKLAPNSLLTRMTTKWALDEFTWWDNELFKPEEPFVSKGVASGQLEPETLQLMSNTLHNTENYNNATNKAYTTDDLLNDMKNSGKFTDDQINLIKGRVKRGTYTKEDLEQIKNTKIYSKSEIKAIIKEEAEKNGIPVTLVEDIVGKESSWVQFDKNKGSEASGLMQLTPKTGKWLGCQNRFDAKENIKAGVKYLVYLKKQFAKYKGNLAEHVVCAYNWGETNYRKYLNGEIKDMPPETKKYKLIASRETSSLNTNMA